VFRLPSPELSQETSQRMSVAPPVNLSMRRSRIVKVTSLQDVRSKHKLLYEHTGKGDADKAERVAWRRRDPNPLATCSPPSNRRNNRDSTAPRVLTTIIWTGS
jgi:hypothetical protein